MNLAIYADASYFLMYRQVFSTSRTACSIRTATWSGCGSFRKGAQPKQAEALSNPVTISVKNLYNPSGGYATFIMPAIIMVIIQQTLLIGIGMVGGTWRELKLYRTLIPAGEKRLAVLPMVSGKTVAYLSVYCLTLLYVLGVHYRIFGYPMNGSWGTVMLFLLPYLLSCIFLGIALSTLFRYRENSLLLLLFTSIPFLMLSGASIPKEWYARMALRDREGGAGVAAAWTEFVRIQTMGGHAIRGFRAVVHAVGIDGGLFRQPAWVCAISSGAWRTDRSDDSARILQSVKRSIILRMRIKTGIAGFGLSGQVFHAPFIHANPGFELTAVVERRTKKAFANYPDVRSVASFGELLEQDVELVVVNTPDATHFDFCRRALEAGVKHVVVEKPFVTTCAEAESLVELAERKGLMLTVYQNRRWDNDFLTVRQVLETGGAGACRRTTVVFPALPAVSGRSRFGKRIRARQG